MVVGRSTATANSSGEIRRPASFEAKSSQPRSSILLPLCVILTLQCCLSLSLRNTTFQDEALYLVAGHQLAAQFQNGSWTMDPYASYFSGLPCLYPVLASALDTFGGLEAARLFSLTCMLAVTVAVYTFGNHLFNRTAGLLATVLFASQGSVLFLGHFATFDALSLLLLALATLLALKASRFPDSTGALGVGMVLSLAAATKYAALLFAPVVLVVLAAETARVQGRRQAIWHTLTAAGVVITGVGVTLALGGATLLHGVAVTTAQRVVLTPLPRWLVAEHAAVWGGLLFVLALAGLIASGRWGQPMFLILLVAALLAPLGQVLKGEATSLHKHVAFGLFFAAPLAGAAIARLGGNWRGADWRQWASLRWATVATICTTAWVLGFFQARALFAAWPNSNALIQALAAQVHPGDTMLAEEPHVPQYYFQKRTSPGQWHDLYWFEYTDNQGRSLIGRDAYQAALAEGYFDVVVLYYGRHPATARDPHGALPQEVDGQLKNNKRYTLVAKVPFQANEDIGSFWVWTQARRPGYTEEKR